MASRHRTLLDTNKARDQLTVIYSTRKLHIGIIGACIIARSNNTSDAYVQCVAILKHGQCRQRHP